jgi:hypothetical protein
MLSRTALAAVLALALSACGDEQPAAIEAVAEPTIEVVQVPLPYAAGTEVLGLEQDAPHTLVESVQSPLSGSLAPAAALSPDARSIAYATWSQDTPSVRLATASDDVLVREGALTPVFRTDGALAYVRGTTRSYTPNVRYVGDLVVRDSPDDADTVWSTEPARYFALGWAGRTLLAYEMLEGEYVELLAFDGPGSARELGEGARLLALSPDGDAVLVADGADVPARLALIDVATGAVRASVDLPLAGETEEAFPSGRGDWSGDLAVVPFGTGLLSVRIGESSLAVEGIAQIDPARYPYGFGELAIARGGRQLVAIADLPPDDRPHTAVVRCELDPLACSTVAVNDAPPGARLVTFVSRG